MAQQWKAIADPEIAKFVEEKFAALRQEILLAGGAIDRARRSLENVVMLEGEIREALRDGIFQRSLELT